MRYGPVAREPIRGGAKGLEWQTSFAASAREFYADSGRERRKRTLTRPEEKTSRG